MAKRWFRFHARSIVEDQSVSRDVDRLSKKFKRFDEAYEALQWLLARKCDDISSLDLEVDEVVYCLYRQKGDALADTPDIVVVYTYDDDEVEILGIRAEETEDEDE